MSKTPMTMRLDTDLVHRARMVADFDKTTLTQLITDLLLRHIVQREVRIHRLLAVLQGHKTPAAIDAWLDSLPGIPLTAAEVDAHMAAIRQRLEETP